ncbi:ribosome-recycling chloroplastic [Chlorella sorokiniana]|uniref:Ribosome-recycling factor, chloroplastic n=1 Tax=Chlorella sorokiniana TaxID=3076 RepID=A0A2P6U3E3_CHLSO|nr:ribosome-recycling chloroplastic [Chlorella sorokiniana]|eukprot:PRW60825.1 ribosome-recycling chloroplastic [Chlorella sorokiniana]
MHVCSAFTNLRCLELRDVHAVPPCLGELTALERLAVVANSFSLGGYEHLDIVDDGLSAALPHLTGLTSLYLMDALLYTDELAGLSRLRHGASAPNPQAGVHSLTDDLLIHILGMLSTEERRPASLLGLLSRSDVRIHDSLRGLTQLTQLLLLARSGGVMLADRVMPPSVRMLALAEEYREELPAQLSVLTGLETLVLDGRGCAAVPWRLDCLGAPGCGAAPSGAPAPNPPAGVHSLPDDLLVHVLGLLSNEERCTAALVSRRWLTCAVAPELWLGFNLPIQTRHAQRLASFRRWLLRHGQHVRRVSIVLFPVGREQHDIATAAAAMPELVACCEALGAAAQQLEMFGLGWLLSAPLEVEAWAPQLPVSLHELALLSSSKLRITSSLGSLTQLTQLLLLGRTSMVLDAGVSLPPSVRMLALGGDGGELPSQLSALTGLGSLVLDKGAWLDEGAQMLTALSSLRSLEIREVEGNVPSGVLSKLTALEHLAVSVRYHVADEDELGMIDGNMAAILRHLTRLTSLYLKDALTAGAAAERRCLNGLTRLQQLYFEHALAARRAAVAVQASAEVEITVEEDAMDRMEKSIESVRRNFASVRTGRANPAMLDRIEFDYYGAQTPLRTVANISTPESTLLVVQPYDNSAIPAIEKAIMASDLGLTPNNDGRVIRLQVPQLTAERRKEMTKTVSKLGEEGKVAIRNVRRDAMKAIEKLEKDGSISEDQRKDLETSVQKLTDDYVKQVDALVKAKGDELTKV